MRQYEISKSNKVLGKVNIYTSNLEDKFNNTLIESNNGLNYETINSSNSQTYEVEYNINDIDELFDIISKYIYDNNKIFETIEEIKKYNDIKHIKKDTCIKIIVTETNLHKLNKTLNDIDLNSLLSSKVYFIKNSTNNNELLINLNNIINDYNNYINSNEYEFCDYDEKKEHINKYINKLDKIIEYIETNTNYKFGRNFIMPIKISNI